MDNASIGYFKDFLQQYNKITEACFSHCINALGDRSLLDDEKKCIDSCVIKHIRVNHKVQSVYLELQPMIINKRVEEFQNAQALSEQAQMQTLPETPATSQPITAQS